MNKKYGITKNWSRFGYVTVLARTRAKKAKQLNWTISERGAPAYRGCGLISAFWRCFAPPIKRMERTLVEASKLATPSTAHRQPR